MRTMDHYSYKYFETSEKRKSIGIIKTFRKY